MTKRLVIFLLAFLLGGCGSGPSAMDRALQFRAGMQTAPCAFTAQITADYGQTCYEFTMDCTADSDGTISFTLTAPEPLADLTGSIRNGKALFSDLAPAFSLLADGRLAPVAAPWTVYNSFRTGYIAYCGPEADKLRLTVDTSFEANPLTVETWLENENLVPIYAEICYNGEDILKMQFSDFRKLTE